MSIEKMKQWLEALKKSHPYSNTDKDLNKHSEAITSLHQAIAEAEKQEPVAWMDKTGITHKHKHFEDMQPLYTHPYVPTKRQPKVEQEPVAMLNRCADEKLQIIYDYDRYRMWELRIGEPQKVYIHPQPKREPLTDAEFAYVWHETTGRIMGTDKALLLQAKRITEAAHGIKE